MLSVYECHLWIVGQAMHASIYYVTLSLNPFPRERDFLSLRSKLFYISIFVCQLVTGIQSHPTAKMAEFPLWRGDICIWSISVPRVLRVRSVRRNTSRGWAAFSAQWRDEETVQLSKVGSYPLIFKHLCESNLPISKIRSIFASYIGKIFVI